MKIILFILLTIIITSCAKPHKVSNNKNDSTVTVLDTNKVLFTDSTVIPTIIRLEKNKPYFISYETNGGSTKQTDILNKENYYDSCRQNLSANELEAHLLAWSIPELNSAQDGNGGLSTIFTSIDEVGNSSNGEYYTLFLYRVYEDGIRAYAIIPSIKVNLKTKKILIGDFNLEYISVEEWRKNNKN